MEATKRTATPFIADERSMLDNWLSFCRDSLDYKCSGLSSEQLVERSAPPSTLSLLGLVRHMADVERYWFRRVLLGEDAPPLFYSEDEGRDPDGDFNAAHPGGAEADFAAWREECTRARGIAAEHVSLDDLGKVQRNGKDVSLRWIMVHMIEEYARHLGHADLLRERIDGAVGY